MTFLMEQNFLEEQKFKDFILGYKTSVLILDNKGLWEKKRAVHVYFILLSNHYVSDPKYQTSNLYH